MLQHKSRRSNYWPLLLLAIGVLLVIGAISWVVVNSASLTPVDSTPTIAAQDRIPYPNVPRVRLPDAKAAYDLKAAVFVDVRGDPAYSVSHIPGALSIPLADLPQRLKELKPQDWIITYCT